MVCVHFVVVVPPPALPLLSALVASLAAVEELVIGRCCCCGGDTDFTEGGEAEGSTAMEPSKTTLPLSPEVDAAVRPLPSPAFRTAGTEADATEEEEAVPPPPAAVATAAVDMTAVAVPATSTSDARMPTFSLSGPPLAAAAAAAAATMVAAVPLFDLVDLFLLPLLDLALLEPPWW